MVTQEGAPSLGGRPGSLDHVLRDTGLSDFKAEFEQLAMDTGGAPQWIVSAHPSDQRAQVRVDLRSRPSLSSSPWIRGAPHSGLSALIRRISARRSASTCHENSHGRRRRWKYLDRRNC